MVINALMKFFGAGSSSSEPAAKPASATASTPSATASSEPKAAPKTSVKELESFVDYVVKALVDNPEDVKIVTEAEGDCKVIKITCRKEDVGKIVGKKGKTIIALRSLVGGAASRLQEKVSVEVID